MTPTHHVTEDQDEILRFLASPDSHGGGGPVKRIDTHGAIVFLTGSDAYKVKRAVRFPYMDFSSLEKRRLACECEIAINRPGAPDIYLGLVPIVRRDGTLNLGGPGTIVEWAVHMRRFDETRTLDRLAAEGALTPAIVAAVARAVAEAHARAPVHHGADFAGALAAIIAENGTSLAEQPVLFPAQRTERLTRQSLAARERVAALLAQRARDGHVRRCHGDLHLGNLVLLDGAPRLFDALEFDEALATTDVLYDLAFLLMDLIERNLKGEANLLLNRYLVESREPGHLAGLAALPLFISVRAAIRAKVTAAGLAHLDEEARERASAECRRYFSLAEAVLDPGPPRLVAVGGLSGTGKSTLAAALAPLIGRPPGAIHLRSDVIRKQLFGAVETERLPDSAYDATATAAVYDRLCRDARAALEAGRPVIVDAVHQRPGERAAIAALAAELGVRFSGLWLSAPLERLVARVEARRGDASDADAAVVTMQAARETGDVTAEPGWRAVDTDGTPDDVLARARLALAQG
ncbi:AAA family ATPase [Chelatococcus daeguensis]|uniref:Aminoglycoside phosphotransferase n=1 Tax=Chelatococcus daeguensis TaxID=444444 RepID=A0AAC9JSM0_9HYPH|nr:bifunctional aminoglycoside phosphotransferase/ATP-binding protein [Chelatococcus daeguensis]APF39513.1 aminoglycoside phosphotransferase [Chelatococcus daeguensis]KZE29130.1 aminoglycoside phosphotransferase [Chelatococcus daeguensis]MBM3083836.1 AAA family ATPase [Chelatococcus daeguensis]